MPSDISANLRDILDAVLVAHQSATEDSDRVWTRDIKDRLCAFGHELGYDVSAAGCHDADDGEWLFDLVWSHGERDELWALPLVMECEWSPRKGDILWDFGKLVIAKSPLKLFVIEQATLAAVSDMTATLTRIARGFRAVVSDERYLLAGYSWSDHRFEYTTILV